jgi:hypothetical protein
VRNGSAATAANEISLAVTWLSHAHWFPYKMHGQERRTPVRPKSSELGPVVCGTLPIDG